MRLELRTTEDSSSRPIMHPWPFYILDETHDRTNNECLPVSVQKDNVSSCVKTASVKTCREIYRQDEKHKNILRNLGNVSKLNLVKAHCRTFDAVLIFIKLWVSGRFVPSTSYFAPNQKFVSHIDVDSFYN